MDDRLIKDARRPLEDQVSLPLRFVGLFSDSKPLVDGSLNGMPKVEKEKVTKRKFT